MAQAHRHSHHHHHREPPQSTSIDGDCFVVSRPHFSPHRRVEHSRVAKKTAATRLFIDSKSELSVEDDYDERSNDGARERPVTKKIAAAVNFHKSFESACEERKK